MASARSPNRERRSAMPVYVSLVKFTREGIMTMKDQGIARSDTVKKNIEGLGGRLIAAYYCLGQYDVVAILEFPDNKRSEEHTSELQSRLHLVCRLLLEKKKKKHTINTTRSSQPH